jgi:molybdate transport repressor ModE-like protein
MTRRSARRRRQQTPLAPRVKVWLETEGHYVFGFGVAEILQAVDRAGSIKQAATDLGLSYRYVWGRIKDAERALSRQLVEAHVGGAGTRRSSLTSEARRLLPAFLALRSRMLQLLQDEFPRHFD